MDKISIIECYFFKKKLKLLNIQQFQRTMLPNKPITRKRIARWTYDLFIEKSKLIHGDKFDYSSIRAYHIKGARSNVPLKCKKETCLHEWNPTIFDHINGKCGCPKCAGHLKWTLTSVVDTAVLIHGDDYDYSLITEAHIKNQRSHIPIICLICDHYWEPTIDNHITGKTRCPSCEGKDPWTLDKVLAKGRQIHGDKFDYSRVTAGDVQGVNSYIPVKCNDCYYLWDVLIASHLGSGNGCPSCSGKLRWTLERFIQRGNELHENKYDYSLIDQSKEINGYISIPILCKTCNHTWDTCIYTHINQGSGCPSCAHHLPWTLERFLASATKLYGDRYDYSLINEDHFHGVTSKIPVKCLKCLNVWRPSIDGHINSMSGCTNCNSSKGEVQCEKVLKEMGISFESQYHIAQYNSKGYDYMFSYNDENYILEFDGKQHFTRVNFFQRTDEAFREQQSRDMIYTKRALDSNFSVIRIDYTQIDKVGFHIQQALDSQNRLYLSTQTLYQHIIDYVMKF